MGDPQGPTADRLTASVREQLIAAIRLDPRSPEQLAEAMWPESRPRSGGKRIRDAISRGWASPELLTEIADAMGLEVEVHFVSRPPRS